MTISTADYHDACNSYEGYCESCDDITTSCVEPDAHGYRCDDCGDSAVCGTEEALLMGLLEIG